MKEPALCSATTKGPRPATSRCGDFAETIATLSNNSSRLATGPGNCSTIVVGLLTSILTCPCPERKGSAVGECRFGSINVRMVYATSSAENGVPSEKTTFLRSSKEMVCPPLETFHELAN